MSSKNAALAALCLGALILNVDTTIVTVALPDLVRQTGATTTDLQWVVDAYSLAFGALVLAAGSLSDRLGRKGMLLAGIAVFGAASLVGSQAGSATHLIGARVAMGVGAAMIYPSTLSLIMSVFTGRRERARAIGLWGACAGAGVAVGPIAGGWLLEHFWWGSIFVLMALLAAVVAAGVAVAVPTSRDPATPPVDWLGLALSGAGMGLLVFGLIEAPGWGWGAASTAAVIAGGVAALAVMAVAETRSAHPMIDVSLFRTPRFTASCGAVAMALFALLGFIFLMTQYFQVVKSYSPLSTGVRLLPLAAAVVVTSIAGTRLAVRVGNKVIISAGLALFGLAMFWTSRESQATSFAILVAQEVVLGAGLGLTQAPTAQESLGAVPAEKAGLASAVNGSARLFGGTLGVAVIGSVASSLYASRLLGTLPPGLPASAVATAKGSVGGAALAAGRLRAAGLGRAAGALDAAAVQAFLHGLAYACTVAGGVAAVGLVLVAVALPGRPRAGGDSLTQWHDGSTTGGHRMTNPPAGRLVPAADGSQLVISRTFRAPIEDVWASVTEPDRTARWFGTWKGEAAPGRMIQVQMGFEEEAPWLDKRIDACDPPRRLALSNEDGGMRIELLLSHADGLTELQLVHHLEPADETGEYGPGWEYYLDMLAAARDDLPAPSFDDYYPAMKPYYEALS